MGEMVSELDALRAEYERIQKYKADSLRVSPNSGPYISRLENMIKVMFAVAEKRENALSFYADEANWVYLHFTDAPVTVDKGQRAREALGRGK
jgi:hypothetical protein